MNFLRRLFGISKSGESISSENLPPVSLSVSTETNNNDTVLSESERLDLIETLARKDIDIGGLEPDERDDLFEEAARLVVQHQQGSASLIQRRLMLGYNRAGRIIDQLEAANIIGPFEGSAARRVNIQDLTSLEAYLQSSSQSQLSNSQLSWFIEKYKNQIEQKRLSLLKELEEEREKGEKERIKQAIVEKEKAKRLKREALNELKEEGFLTQNSDKDSPNRQPIPQEVMDKVWNRDQGKCVQCGSKENLEFDHIIPFSKGGANTYRNLQLLCQTCNRSKSNKIG